MFNILPANTTTNSWVLSYCIHTVCILFPDSAPILPPYVSAYSNNNTYVNINKIDDDISIRSRLSVALVGGSLHLPPSSFVSVYRLHVGGWRSLGIGM